MQLKMETHRYRGQGRKTGKRHSGRHSPGRWAGIPAQRQLISSDLSVSTNRRRGKQVYLTETKDNHISTDDDGAHGRREELGDTAQDHNHAHGDVDKSAANNQSLAPCTQSQVLVRHETQNIQDIGKIHFECVSWTSSFGLRNRFVGYTDRAVIRE